MRYIGSKISLLQEIESVMPQYRIGQTFCDIFSGTACVARHFKDKYRVLSNDILYFSYVLQTAYLQNNELPKFKGLDFNPFGYLNNEKPKTRIAFISKNYSPNNGCERMFFTSENALRIDFARESCEKWFKDGAITQNEYFYLIATIIEATPFVSNITGTYGAYLKTWDKRAFKKFEIKPLELKCSHIKRHASFNKNASELIREISGDILYLDPPYNSRQYGANYHLLETIAKYDEPIISGKVGTRNYDDLKSNLCNSKKALNELEQIIRDANFHHIVLSYNDEGIICVDELEELLKKYAKKNSYNLKRIPYRRYKRTSGDTQKSINELLFYIEKG